MKNDKNPKITKTEKNSIKGSYLNEKSKNGFLSK